MTHESERVERLDAADVTAVLMAVMEQPGEAFLLQPLKAAALVIVRLQGGMVSLQMDQNCRPAVVLEAVSPDGREWSWGCQRDWLADGAPVVDPLTAELRERLGEALKGVTVMEEMAVHPASVWPDHEAVARRQLNVKNSQRRKRSRAKPVRRAPQREQPIGPFG
jgi:hypothetical protein